VAHRTALTSCSIITLHSGESADSVILHHIYGLRNYYNEQRKRTFKVRKLSLKVHFCNKNFGTNLGLLHPKTATNLALHEYLIALSKYHPGQACNMRKLGFSRLHKTDNADNLGWRDNNESLI